MSLPDTDEHVMSGVRWGSTASPFTPAFWKAQLWYAHNEDIYAYLDYRSGKSLHEELSACLLGGHGVTSEVAQAAFVALQSSGLLRPNAERDSNAFTSILKVPLTIPGKARPALYRYPQMKARYLAAALKRLDSETAPQDDRAFRDWLLSYTGVGWKTASWITRNWLHSNAVAIIDIHVFRAGVIAGFFSGTESVIQRKYRDLELRFLEFARGLGEEPRRLDVLLWRVMKDSHNMGRSYFQQAPHLSRRA